MKLLQKCIWFVLILLSVQLAVFCALTTLELSSDQQTAKITQSNEIIGACLVVTSRLDDSLADFFQYGLSHDRQLFDKLADDERELQLGLHRLQQAVPGSSEDEKDVEKLGKQIHYLFQIVVPEFRAVLLNPELSHFDLLFLRQRVKGELVPVVSDALDTARAIASRHEKYIAPMVAESKLQRSSIRTILLSGIVLSFFGAFVAVVGFSRSVTKRLGRLEENIERLRTDKPLTPPVLATDEIGKVDINFHEMAAALKDAKEKDRAVMANMPVGLVVCDGQNRIEQVNSVAVGMFKRVQSEIIGRSLNELVQSMQGKNDARNAHEMISPGRYSISRNTKDTLPVELTTSTFVSGGQEKHLYAIADVSARVEVERLKEEFMAIVSHDLRSPLSAIQCTLSEMQLPKGELDDGSSKSINVANASIKRLIKLTDDLLEVAKLDDGKIVLETKVIDPAVLVERSVDALSPAAKEKGVEITVEHGEGFVQVDADRMTQVVLNLLSNAIKFSPAEGHILVRSFANEPAGRAMIEVVDEGPGIAPEFQREIFEKFKRSSTDKSKSGVGLGLAISKLFVEAHGGIIGVDSTPGKGSRFWVELPLVSESAFALQSD
ncbi:MAG: hypothetical protein C5B53_06210 [Candidatus Melainabacteria bacterium]|nr:MAG: hypothetical protein C5B53_06210 [Candidatus Melainabacteria bacterium]